MLSHSRRHFEFDLTTPEPIPVEGIDRACQLMGSGRLFRYREEASGGPDEAGLLEVEMAEITGCKYAVAVSSCGAAMFLALRSSGLAAGDKVLTNSFTLAPVPGAIHHAGGVPVIVETTQDLTMDLGDLAAKASESGARWLLLSHMRGHISNMDEIVRLCQEFHIKLIEDCAHTFGATWADKPSGTFGVAGCFSFQTFKHVNSGEGGVIVTNDDDVAAKAILYSGSYMLYEQHKARPGQDVFERIRDEIPNYSMRMNAVAAAVARPQLRLLPERIAAMNKRYGLLATLLGQEPLIRISRRDEREHFVGSSIQFNIPSFSTEEMESFVDRCAEAGLNFNWFGRARMQGFTSRPDQWKFLRTEQPVPQASKLLSTLCDMRVPPTLPLEDCEIAAEIIIDSIKHISKDHGGGV